VVRVKNAFHVNTDVFLRDIDDMDLNMDGVWWRALICSVQMLSFPLYAVQAESEGPLLW
jgi:hypothetical protein